MKYIVTHDGDEFLNHYELPLNLIDFIRLNGFALVKRYNVHTDEEFWVIYIEHLEDLNRFLLEIRHIKGEIKMNAENDKHKDVDGAIHIYYDDGLLKRYK